MSTNIKVSSTHVKMSMTYETNNKARPIFKSTCSQARRKANVTVKGEQGRREESCTHQHML